MGVGYSKMYARMDVCTKMLVLVFGLEVSVIYLGGTHVNHGGVRRPMHRHHNGFVLAPDKISTDRLHQR